MMADSLKRTRHFHPALLLPALALLLSLTGCASLGQETGTAALPDTGVAAQRVEGVPAVPYAGAEDAVPAEELVAAAASEELHVRFLDVGQGDSALITCGSESLLIDGGPKGASQKLYAVLKDLGITHLDHVIATHPDADHCGGLAGALQFASCGMFYCSVTEHDTQAFNNVVERLGATSITVPKAGDSFALGPATVQFVGPVMPAQDSNEGSLVCKLTYGEVSFLFTGDATDDSEAAMLASGMDLDSDVLKVGHHGSASSSTAPFLAAVSPEYAVISVGANNGYGHPAEDALERLRATGADIMCTDEVGTIAFATDGEGLSVSAFKGKVE